MSLDDLNFRMGSLAARIILGLGGLMLAVRGFGFDALPPVWTGWLAAIFLGLFVYSFIRLRRTMALALLVVLSATALLHLTGVSGATELGFAKSMAVGTIFGAIFINDDTNGVF